MLDRKAAAGWMWEEIQRQKWLYQSHAANQLRRRFGVEATYRNRDGGTAIERGILRAFRTLSEGQVIWSRSDQRWRLKQTDRRMED